VHLPNPADPSAHGELIRAIGGVDLFLLASGVSGGHLAFNPPGTDLVSTTGVIELPQGTRQEPGDLPGLRHRGGQGSVRENRCTAAAKTNSTHAAAHTT